MNGYRLEISVLSNCDAALLVNAADTQWFYDDDDSNGKRTRVLILYQIGRLGTGS
jgi:hypothetical protein